MNNANSNEREQSCYLSVWMRGIFVTQITPRSSQQQKGLPSSTTDFQDPSHGSNRCSHRAKDQHGASRLGATPGTSQQGLLSPLRQHSAQKTKSSLNSKTSSGIWFLSRYNPGCLLQPESPVLDLPLCSLFPHFLVNTLWLGWNVEDIVKPSYLPQLFWDKKLIL